MKSLIFCIFTVVLLAPSSAFADIWKISLKNQTTKEVKHYELSQDDEELTLKVGEDFFGCTFTPAETDQKSNGMAVLCFDYKSAFTAKNNKPLYYSIELVACNSRNKSLVKYLVKDHKGKKYSYQLSVECKY